MMTTRRARKRARRTEEMLDAAMSLVLEGGLENLTIARLADRLDAAVGAIYRYFSSKDMLMMALQKRAIAAFHTDLERSIGSLRKHDDPKITALVRLLGACQYYLEDATIEPTRHRLMDTFLSAPGAVLSVEDAREVNATVIAPVIELFTAKMEQAVESGALSEGDNEQRTYALWAALHGLDHFRKRDRILPERLQTPTLAQMTLNSMLLGWGATESALATAFSLLSAH